MGEVLERLLEAVRRHESVALATVVEVRGGSPAALGFKGLVWPDGRFEGNVGGGVLEQRIRADAQEALQEGASRLIHYSLKEKGEDAVGMVCGGEVRVFIEVFEPQPRLLIVGGGHVGQPLAEMARRTGFRVDVVDVDPDRATLDEWDPSDIDRHTYVVLVTEDHRTDMEALRAVIDSPAAYIGMIGSRAKVATIFLLLQEEGVSPEQLERVHAPIGLDLGGDSPAEIALSILAEIQKVRYRASGKSLSEGMPVSSAGGS